MAEKIVNAMVEGGKATPGPPLGPSLAPMGVPVPQVIQKINEATKAFAGMNVPVKVIIDSVTKEFHIEVGSPPLAEIIKKEAKIEKGAGDHKAAKAGNLSLTGAVKVAKMNQKSLSGDVKNAVKEVVGTCVSMGITIEGKDGKAFMKELDKGMHDSALK